MTRPVESTRYHVNAVLVSLKILSYLAENPGKSSSEMAQALGLTNSLCFRMLATLESEGMVVRDHNRQYALGYKCMYLGFRAQRSLPLNEVAEPMIRRLVQVTSESVHLVIRDGLERVIVAMRESPHPVRVSTPIGAKFPLHYGGTGLCIFAFLEPATQEIILAQQLPQKTPKTLTEADQIRQLAQEIRQRGYHVARGDFADSAFSVAAPIFAAGGSILGSICVAGPESRLGPGEEKLCIDEVVWTAAQISTRLGYRSQAEKQ